jgi:hypothetical protein
VGCGGARRRRRRGCGRRRRRQGRPWAASPGPGGRRLGRGCRRRHERRGQGGWPCGRAGAGRLRAWRHRSPAAGPPEAEGRGENHQQRRDEQGQVAAGLPLGRHSQRGSAARGRGCALGDGLPSPPHGLLVGGRELGEVVRSTGATGRRSGTHDRAREARGGQGDVREGAGNSPHGRPVSTSPASAPAVDVGRLRWRPLGTFRAAQPAPATSLGRGRSHRRSPPPRPGQARARRGPRPGRGPRSKPGSVAR